MIAQRMCAAHFEDVFLAGLLHDLGIVLEDQHVHGSFVETIQSARAGKTLVDVEQAHLGFDHTLLGEKVAQQWNLPNGVADAMRDHHDSAACQGNYWDTVQCVEVANYLCSATKHSSIGMQLVNFPGALHCRLRHGNGRPPGARRGSNEEFEHASNTLSVVSRSR